MASIRSKLCRMLAKRMIGSAFNSDISIEEIRSTMEKATKMAFLPAKTRVDKVSFNTVAAEWITSANAHGDTVILYLHGGGYNTGSPNTHREFAAHLSKDSRTKVLLPDYRLAPENPFPAALEDAVTSYRYLLENGYSGNKIAIAGESAGGGLTLATCLSLRDQNLPLPVSLTCLSPWTDLEMTGDSFELLEKIDPMLNALSLHMMASNYVCDHNPRAPLISPLHADFNGFPPLLIHVGSDEMLLDDSKRVATKARQNGVDVTLKVYDQMWHFFHVFYRLMPEAKAATKEIAAFIQKHFK